jgi:hypothetical protein
MHLPGLLACNFYNQAPEKRAVGWKNERFPIYSNALTKYHKEEGIFSQGKKRLKKGG